MPPTIGAINVYPIKSCRGVSLQSAFLTEAGLMFDREWMVVREDTGKFISQREKELLALVEVALAPEALIAAHSGLSQLPPGSVMTVTAPGMDEPLQIPLGRRPNCDTRKVTVWEWTGLGEDEGADAASWFSRYLGVPCRLVRYLGSSTGGSSTGGSSTGGSSTGGSSTGGATEQPRAQQQQQAEAAAAGIVGASSLPYMRTTEPEYAVGYETRFSDGYPMLLVTQAALAALNAKLAEPLPMNRFRPNIEVAGADPWAEDGWRDMEVQSSSAPFPSDGPTLRLTAVKPCSRCKVTTINQDTARVGDEPLEALGTFRSGKVLGWSTQHKAWTHAVFFGWNVVSRTPGVLSVGDTITVVTTQTPAALVAAS